MWAPPNMPFGSVMNSCEFYHYFVEKMMRRLLVAWTALGAMAHPLVAIESGLSRSSHSSRRLATSVSPGSNTLNAAVNSCVCRSLDPLSSLALPLHPC